MRTFSKFCFLAVATTVILAASALPARADIVVCTCVQNQGTDNVLLTSSENLAVTTGTVVGVPVYFTSTSGSTLLTANPSGQATVAGGDGNAPFSNISFFGDPNMTFTRAVFNVNAEVGGDILLTITGINIDGGMFQNQYSVDANGENFFTATASNGQLMKKVDITAVGNTSFDDIRQVRIGGVNLPGDETLSTVPEPASMLLLGTGFTGIAAVLRRRKKNQ